MRCSCDRAHRLLGVERQLRDQRRAGLQAGQNAGLVAEVVEERVDAQVAVGAGDLSARRPRRRRVERLPVRAQRALAAAGGAGGEQDVGDVVGLDRRGAGHPPRRGRFRARRTRPRFRRPSRSVPGRCAAAPAGNPGPVRRSCRRRRTRPSPPAAAPRCAPGCRWPRRGVAGVQRHHDPARVVRGQACDHPVPGVRRPDRHPVAGADAHVDHPRGGPSDLGPQLGERQPPIDPGRTAGTAGSDQRVVVGELVGNPVENRRNGPRLCDPGSRAPARRISSSTLL